MFLFNSTKKLVLSLQMFEEVSRKHVTLYMVVYVEVAGVFLKDGLTPKTDFLMQGCF